MRVWPLALLLAACSSSPYVQFDGGCDLHVIVVVEGGPTKIEAVCRAGAATAKPPWRTIRQAAEVAILHVPRGEHSVSVWEKRSDSRARRGVHVDRELWLVFTVRPGRKDSSIDVHRTPPRDRAWQPLVALPR